MRPPLNVCLPPPPGTPSRAKSTRGEETPRTVSRPANARRNQLDLKRNSADAIAPAMTSSAPQSPPQRDGNPWSNLPAPSQEGTALRMLALNQEKPTWPNCLPRRSPLPLRLSGEEPLPDAPAGHPDFPCGTEKYSHHLVDVKREILHIVFYSDSPPYPMSNAALNRTLVPWAGGFNARSRCSEVHRCGL